MEDADFKEFFQKIVDCYGLAPNIALEMLQRILAILKDTEDKVSQADSKYEVLPESVEREERL